MSWKSQNKPINVISKPVFEADCNLKATIKSSDVINKPSEFGTAPSSDNQSQRELQLIKELESWRNILKSYQDAYGTEIPDKPK